MVRQCAWCLRLIDSSGERISPSPLPKLYEATHGICGTCGIEWMEQVIMTDEAAKSCGNNGSTNVFPQIERQEQQGQQEERRETIVQLILQLQQKPADTRNKSRVKPTKKTRSL